MKVNSLATAARWAVTITTGVVTRCDLVTISALDVIAFLKRKRDSNIPAWKRLKFIEGLMVFRREVQNRGVDDLLQLHEMIVKIIEIERARNGGYDNIEDVVGEINPNESDAVQKFRRALRRDGKKYRTERSYVGKLSRRSEQRRARWCSPC